MVGTVYPSEKRTYTDEKSGAQITQLTDQGINYHFYFTEIPSIWTEKPYIFCPTEDMRERRTAICLKWIWTAERWYS